MELKRTRLRWITFLLLVPAYWLISTITTYADSPMDKSAASLLMDTMTTTPSVTEKSFLIESVTPTLTLTVTPTYTNTITPTPTPTFLPSSTLTASPSLAPSLTATLTPTQTPPLVLWSNSITETWGVFLPFIIRFPTPTPTPTPPPPPQSYLFCRTYSPPAYIPDQDPNGLSSQLHIDTPGWVVETNVYLSVNHSWVGDLSASLGYADLEVNLFDRPGFPNTQLGCSYDHIRAIFSDPASQLAENKCSASPAAMAGMFRPGNPLSQFQGLSAAGNWTLQIVDAIQYDTGSLNKWCLQMLIGSVMPSPTPTPTPVSLPSNAYVPGMHGQDQALPLDCESRAAVDWADHFSKQIDELEFYSRLPHSDDPDDGFVGDVYGTWGQIPPNDYGVHAEPVAKLLRQYGLVAHAYRPLRWDDIRAEISAGRPVIVWVTGSTTTGAPLYYQASSDQHISIVAPYEHTVNVIGYTQSTVTILDGASIYTRSLDQFLDSWSALGNMAILARP